MKIIILTDLHFGQKAAGDLPRQRLTRAFEHIARWNPDTELIVLTGDLTHEGHPEDYATLRDVLAKAHAPVQLMIGNHDHRASFLDAFPDTLVTTSGHVQSAKETPTTRLIFLDTLQAPPYSYPFSHIGVLCEERLAWLDAELAKGPCVLFMHHPPHDTGFKAMDAIKLGNGPALYDLIERHGTVRHIIAGHVHRTISGSHRGVPFTIFKSLVGQMPMLFDRMDFHMECDEPAAYGILTISAEGVIAHTEDFELTDLAAIK